LATTPTRFASRTAARITPGDDAVVVFFIIIALGVVANAAVGVIARARVVARARETARDRDGTDDARIVVVVVTGVIVIVIMMPYT
jgi:membrane protein required for beta-lactamase induction